MNKTSINNTAAVASANRIPLEDLGVSNRTLWCFHNHGIKFTDEVLGMSTGEMMKMRNFGRLSFDEIMAHLAAIGTPHPGDVYPQEKAKVERAIRSLMIRIEELKKEIPKCEQRERLVEKIRMDIDSHSAALMRRLPQGPPKAQAN